MRRVWSVVVGAVVVSLVFAGGAFAAVTGLETVERLGVLDSTTGKTVTATCPAGKQLVGAAAGKTFAADGQARMLALRPSADLRSAVSVFREDETGFGGNWQAITYALCSTPLTGMQRVAATSASNSATKSVTATCPSGKRLIGVGGETAGGQGQVVLDVLRPNQGLTAAVVSAREDRNGFAGNWTLSAYAVCAVAPQGLVRVAANRAAGDEFTDVVAACPSGKGLVGVGGEIANGAGRVSLETYVLPGSEPGSEPSTYARGWQDETGNYFNWSVTAYAICANSAVRDAIGGGPPGSPPGVNLGKDCPAGKQATGLGGDISGGLGQVMLNGLFFGLSVDFGATADEDDDGFSGSWALRGYGICATPIAGRELVAGESASDSVTTKSAQAFCPAGKRVVGAGGRIIDGGGRVLLDEITPNSSLTGVTAVGEEDEGIDDNDWSVSAQALCANPPPGLQLVSAVSELDSDVASEKASCPAGKHLLGTGGGFANALGEVMLDDLRPDAALKTVTVTGLEDETGYGNDWAVRAHAICANY